MQELTIAPLGPCRLKLHRHRLCSLIRIVSLLLFPALRLLSQLLPFFLKKHLLFVQLFLLWPEEMIIGKKLPTQRLYHLGRKRVQIAIDHRCRHRPVLRLEFPVQALSDQTEWPEKWAATRLLIDGILSRPLRSHTIDRMLYGDVTGHTPPERIPVTSQPKMGKQQMKNAVQIQAG